MTDAPPKYRATRVAKDTFSAAADITESARETAQRIIADAKATAAELTAQATQQETSFENRVRNMTDAQVRQYIDDQTMIQSAKALANMLNTAASIRAEFETMTPWFVGFVGSCLQRIVGQIDTDVLIARVVSEAVAEMSVDHSLMLRVHTADLANLKRLAVDRPDVFAAVTSILPDANLKEGEMMLEGAGGFVKLGLATAIKATVTNLEQVLGEMAQPPQMGRE
ncbi:hypothetical protein [Yoonia sp.]|uniref:hypothetical protein n=1 Tax=Yoonia sp. TaxID=2212373 RepID=UPI0025DED918|nr:hypothetical protein [Yoonia sp.]